METIKVLIIEDDDDYSFLEKDILVDELGAECTVVKSGQQVTQGLLSQMDVVLLDYNLPDSTGSQVLQFIRNHSDIPVLLITGDDSLKTAVETLKGGATDFLVKTPETILLLPTVVKNAVQDYRRAKALEQEKKEKERLALKIETLKQVLTTLAHYINNSTTTISGYAQLCSHYPDDMERYKKLAQVSLKETRKITLVLKELEELVINMEIKTTNYTNIPDAMFAIEEGIKKKLAREEQEQKGSGS